MIINTTVKQDLSVEDLAKCLSESTPQEFAQFWFKFSEEMEKVDKKDMLDKFAEAMSPYTGSLRKHSFYRLYHLMQYYEVKEEMDKNNIKVSSNMFNDD